MKYREPLAGLRSLCDRFTDAIRACASSAKVGRGQRRLFLFSWTPVPLTLLLIAVATKNVRAGEIYISVAPDGSDRYATEALDPSYRLIDVGVGLAPLSSAGLTPSSKRDPIGSIIKRAASRHGVSPALVEAIVSVESTRNPIAVSGKGAQGAMQLMPATAARYGLRGQDWRDPKLNIDAGVRHLKSLIEAHHGNVALALAAYNAGRGATARYGERIPPYRETMIYVAAVLARAAAAAAPAAITP